MRNLRWASFLCAAFVVASSLSTYADEPTWILNNGPDVEDVLVGQGGLFEEFGLVKIKSQGTDCTVTLPIESDDIFDSAERPFFALRYKIESKQTHGGIFFTNDQGLSSLSDESYSSFEIVGDGAWHNLIVDMRTYSHKNWHGNIKSFRLDPTNPSDLSTTCQLSRLGFFASREDAEKFLNEANDEPDFSMDVEFNESFQHCLVPGGSLTKGYDRNAFILKNADALRTLAQEAPFREDLVVVNKREDGKNVVVPLCDVSSRGFATFVARDAQELSLVSLVKSAPSDVAGRDTEAAIRYVVARGLMSTKNGKFLPTDKTSADELKEITQTLRKFGSYGTIGQKVASLSDKLSADQSREETALIVANGVRAALGTRVDSPYTKEYFERDRIRVGAWGNFRPYDFDDEYMRTYADCGFDFVLAMSGIPSKKLLEAGDKYGVEVYVNDGSYLDPVNGDAEYCDHPSFTGCYVIDEPGSDSYDKLAAKCNPYVEATGKEAYVNLLPMYANAAQLKYGAGAAAIEYYDADPDLFRKYCSSFCEKFKSKYICTDIYPLNWTADRKKSTYADYVESINIIASVAREYDREFWCYIQTFAWIPSKRTPTEAEYRWQCYSMLSFGCRCILCWTYAGYKEDFPSLVDIESKRTTAWYDARPVFWELRRLSDEYVKYRNIGAFTHNCTEETPYLKMSGEYKDFSTIKEIDCAQPLLIGCFEKNENAKETAFTLVNMSELEANSGASVRMKLQGDEAIAWYRGVPQKIEPNDDGWFEFNLASGEGVFVTVK